MFTVMLRRINRQPALSFARKKCHAGASSVAHHAATSALLVRSLDAPCEYLDAWAWQQREHGLIMRSMDKPDQLLLLEHLPVYTLGRGAKLENVLFDPDSSNIAIHRVERGGQVTYHGPGQVVGYPILNLARGQHRKDLHWYLRQVEEVLIKVLDVYGLQGGRMEEYTGVWVGEAKLAAIGLSASKWVTMHGFAMNVCPDLTAFEKIIPCGIHSSTGLRVSSLHQELIRLGAHKHDLPSSEEVREQILNSFVEIFGFDHFEVERVCMVPREVEAVNERAF